MVSVVYFVVVVCDGASDWSIEDRRVLCMLLLLLKVFIDIAVIEVEYKWFAEVLVRIAAGE